jgi:hypothetical protein
MDMATTLATPTTTTPAKGKADTGQAKERKNEP